MNVSIPVNATAMISVPAASQASVTEQGRPAGTADGVKFMAMDGAYAVFQVAQATTGSRAQLSVGRLALSCPIRRTENSPFDSQHANVCLFHTNVGVSFLKHLVQDIEYAVACRL